MSLSRRLIAGMIAVAIVLVAAAVINARATRSYLIERLDAQLRDVTSAPSIDLATPSPPAASPPAVSGSRLTGTTVRSLNSLYLARISHGVVTVLAAPNVPSDQSGGPRIPVARVTAAGFSSESFTVGAKHGSTRFRVRAVRASDGSTIVVALSQRDVDASVHRLIFVEVLTLFAVIMILGLVTFWVLRLGVRPIKKMTATASAIAAGDLSQRLPAGQSQTEATALGDALNAMLTRIEDAFEERAQSEARLRRFVADASHELRTPVTTIRGYAELYRHGGLDAPDELTQAMRRTEQESIRMALLIDDLLLLARLDEGRPLARAAVDLGVLSVDAVADARAISPDRAITAQVREGVTVAGDEDRLRQVLANLVGNALLHTRASSPVAVRVDTSGANAVVEVHDEGPGMSADVAARAFERFSRADASRSRHSGGAGLGLAIVRAIVDAHGGQVSLTSSPRGGTTVLVALPRLRSTET